MKLKSSEKWLMIAPLVVGLGVWVFNLILTKSRPRLLSSPVPINQAWWTPDGKIVAIGKAIPQHGEHVLPDFFLYDAQSGQLLEEHAEAEDTGYSSLSPDGQWLLTNERDTQTSRLIALELRDVRNHFAMAKRLPWSSLNAKINWISSTQFTATQSKWNSLTRKAAHKKLLFDVPSLKSRLLSQSPRSPAYDELSLSTDGKTAALIEETYSSALKVDTNLTSSGSMSTIISPLGAQLQLLSWPEGQKQTQLKGDLWRCARFLPDGHTLIALATLADFDRFIRLDVARFDLRTHRTSWTKIDLGKNPIMNSLYEARFSPDGHFLAVKNAGIDAEWTLWNTQTGQMALTIPRLKPNALRFYQSDDDPHFSPDSRTFLRPTPQGIELWDLSRLQ